MSKSLVLSMGVLYETRTKLKAIITFYLPDNSKLENPDNTTNDDFNISSNGPPTDPNNVIMNFKEIQKSTPSKTYIPVIREAIITLNSNFSNTQETMAKLFLNGQEESEKSQTGANYEEDPEFIEDPDK